MRRLQLIRLVSLGAVLASFSLHAADNPPPDRARLLVRLPAAASLLVGSTPANQGGAQRILTSPPLGKAKKYRFNLTATWNDNGAPRKVVRSIVVQAGKISTVDLNPAVAATSKKTAQTLAPKTPVVQTKKDSKPSADLKKRAFEFTYATTVTGLSPGQVARVWLPMAQSSVDQDVYVRSKDVPAQSRIETETTYGNHLLFAESAADDTGKVRLKIVYQVTRREAKGENIKEAADDPELLKRYLQADALVPIDGKPLELIKDLELPADSKQKARALYEIVNSQMRYSTEDTGWGRGDVNWACENKYGNCTDFHSLFISLARAQKIPAKFEIGFSLPQQHGAGDIAGYHCWAKCKPAATGWIPVDISEANKDPKMKEYYFGNLTENRVAFSTGRDLVLSPQQAGPPINFLIYPYVEVDGKIYPREKVISRFSFKDE